MPMHDWSRIHAGTYHNFHHLWLAVIVARLNQGLLPAEFYAMAEQSLGVGQGDIITLQSPPTRTTPGTTSATILSILEPKTKFRKQFELDPYAARKANRIVVRHVQGEIVAVIELVSPGNKDRAHAMQQFVHKMVHLFCRGINLLIIDLFPPNPHNPEGIHPLF